MKQLLLLITLFSTLVISAQPELRMLKKVAEIQMPDEAIEGYPGTRGASITWHPVLKRYYAAMAGNFRYPLASFDASGKRVSPDDQVCLVDVRGLWYDPATKTIQGNAFDNHGWFSYKMNSQGIVTDLTTIMDGMYQPDAQSVGAFNPQAKTVLFQKNGKVYYYKLSNGELTADSLVIQWGVSKTPDRGTDSKPDLADYNYTTIIYTGLPNAQLGFLKTYPSQVELYSAKTGLLTQVLKFPEDAPAESSFNFAYTNNTWWLFDMVTRKWFGYK